MLLLVLVIAAVSLTLAVSYLFSRRKKYSIRGKHVLITGGSSGIGKALAAEALRRGAAAVTLLARNGERLAAAKAELEKNISDNLKQQVHTVQSDVSSEEVKEAIAAAVGSTGHVQVLVNCAGVTHTAPLQDTPAEVFQDMLRVNVLGGVYVTQALLPAMVERKGGKVVFISSQAGQVGMYGYSAYSASKFAIRGLAESLQMEVAPHNIGVCISFPPDTDTPQLHAEQLQRSQHSIAGELASFSTVFQPEQVAREVWGGVERGDFQISHGLDGFMLGTLTAGMTPAAHVWNAVVQVLLMGVFRVVSLVYLHLFYRVVRRGLRKEKKSL